VSEEAKPGLFVKGGKPGPGRPKGLPNLNSRELKENLMTAFRQVGGKRYLVKLAKENPEIFCRLLGKVLPVEKPVAQNTTNVLNLNSGDRNSRDDLLLAQRLAFVLDRGIRAGHGQPLPVRQIEGEVLQLPSVDRDDEKLSD
jgi:hypothetical protein